MNKYQKVCVKHGKPKPILFNTEMVRAILEGRKTQTRRPQKHQKEFWDYYNQILYVRETFRPLEVYMDGERQYLYRADLINAINKAIFKIFKQNNVKWKPSIHMPKELARIFLKVTDVRVERLQEISEKDAEAEGFIPLSPDKKIGYPGITAKECFKDSWNSIYKNKGYGWKENPWVWVIEFKRLEV